VIGLDIYNTFSVSFVLPTINVNQVNFSHIRGLTLGASIFTFSVTYQCQLSLSKKDVVQAQLISVQLQVALVTVIALVDVVFQELITNLFWWLNMTVSNQEVNALIQTCITLQTSSIVQIDEKFNQVMLLAVQSIVILKLQSVTAFRVVTTFVGYIQDIK
jgi:hypothetical protein